MSRLDEIFEVNRLRKSWGKDKPDEKKDLSPNEVRLSFEAELEKMLLYFKQQFSESQADCLMILVGQLKELVGRMLPADEAEPDAPDADAKSEPEAGLEPEIENLINQIEDIVDAYELPPAT